MPSLPSNLISSQPRATYLVVSEFLNVFRKGGLFFFRNFSFVKSLPVIYTLLSEKIVAFFFTKSEVVPLKLTLKSDFKLSFFFVSESGSKILLFRSDKIMILAKIFLEKKDFPHVKKNSVFFKEFNYFNFAFEEIEKSKTMRFNPEENYFVVSCLDKRIVIFNLEKQTKFFLKTSGPVERLEFPIIEPFSFKLNGKIQEKNFFQYDLEKKTFFLFSGTEKFSSGKGFFFLHNNLSVYFFCQCHKRLLKHIQLKFKIINFLVINPNRILSLTPENLVIFQTGFCDFQKLKTHRYTPSGLDSFWEDLSKVKTFQSQRLNFYVVDRFNKKNWYFFKPLSEKHFSLVNFRIIESLDKKTNDVKFFGKGSSVAVTSGHNTVKFFSGLFLKYLGEVVFGDSNILNFQIKGSTLIVVSSNGGLALFDLVSFKLIECFKLHNSSISIFCINRDIYKRGVFISAKKKLIKFWSLNYLGFSTVNIKLIRLDSSFNGKISAIAISFNSQFTAFASNKKEIFISKYPFGKALKISALMTENSSALSFSPEGKFLAAGLIDGSVIIFSVPNGLGEKKFHGDGASIHACFFSLASSHIFCVNNEGKIRILQFDKGLCVNILTNPKDPIYNFDLSQEENFLIAGCNKGSLVLMKDMSSYYSKKKKTNFSLFLDLQKSLDKKSGKNFKKGFEKILEYRDPVLFLDFFKFFSLSDKNEFRGFFCNFIKTTNSWVFSFLFKSMLYWNTIKNGIIWSQQLSDMIFSNMNLSSLPKIDSKVCEALIWNNNQWLRKLREFNREI